MSDGEMDKLRRRLVRPERKQQEHRKHQHETLTWLAAPTRHGAQGKMRDFHNEQERQDEKLKSQGASWADRQAARRRASHDGGTR
jgi:hypothetical protein